MKEEMKKEEIKKEETKIDNNSVIQLAEKPRLLKGFRVEETTTQAGKKYSKLFITTLQDKETSLFLSDSQIEIINLVGQDNCFVDIEKRYSDKVKKSYYVVALHCDDVVLEFFVKDRAFVTLALLQAKKVLGDDYPEI